MVIANERSAIYGGVLRNVWAILFFGVPHRGADTAYWATFVARLLEFGRLGFRPNSEYVSALKRNSETLANISVQFIDRVTSLAIRTFYETEKMGNQLVSAD